MAVLAKEVGINPLVSKKLLELCLSPVTELIVSNCEATIFLVNLCQLLVFVSKQVESELVFLFCGVVLAELCKVLLEKSFDNFGNLPIFVRAVILQARKGHKLTKYVVHLCFKFSY